MRRFACVALASGVGLALLPSVAAAGVPFDRHFTVTEDPFKLDHTDNGFTHKAKLRDKFTGERVGRDFAACKFPRKQSGKLHCKLLIHLDGTIGGLGNLLVRGNLGHGDHSLLVINGEGDFNGVAGKVVIRTHHDRNPDLHFSLVR